MSVWSDIMSFPNAIHKFPLQLTTTNVILGLLIAYLVYLVVYGLFICPTRHLPGPFLTRFGEAYFLSFVIRGITSAGVASLHKRYGFPAVESCQL